MLSTSEINKIYLAVFASFFFVFFCSSFCARLTGICTKEHLSRGRATKVEIGLGTDKFAMRADSTAVGGSMAMPTESPERGGGRSLNSWGIGSRLSVGPPSGSD